ncbi:hypothetical protein GW17_00033890 [Ensete ventricosum]|nr:hypothetical protein GW17_00033890 [Ensete ventricosum]
MVIVPQFNYLDNRIKKHANAFTSYGLYGEPSDATLASQVFACSSLLSIFVSQMIFHISFLLQITCLPNPGLFSANEFFFFSNGSYYPLYPPSLGVPLDLSLAPEALDIPLIPDILILPSDLAPFVKVNTIRSSFELI